MRLSWNEVRARAAAFADEWRDAAYEKGETQSFYNAFFDVFGVRRRNVVRYEAHVAKLDNRSGFIDLFWPGVLLVEQKSAGRNLKAAYEQAGEYFDALPERDRPRYIMVSDFRTFELHDLDERETVSFPLVELPSHVEAFGFILGVQRRTFRDQDPANVKLSLRNSSTTCRLKFAVNLLLSAMMRSFPLPIRHSNLLPQTVQLQGVSPILSAFGVPPTLFNHQGDGVGQREAWRRWWLATAQPIVKIIIQGRA